MMGGFRIIFFRAKPNTDNGVAINHLGTLNSGNNLIYGLPGLWYHDISPSFFKTFELIKDKSYLRSCFGSEYVFPPF